MLFFAAELSNHQSEPSCVFLQSAILLQPHKYVTEFFCFRTALLMQTKRRLHALIEDFLVCKICALSALCY